MPIDSWNNPDNQLPETDAAILRSSADTPKKTKSGDAGATLRWRLSFTGIRNIATDIATLNRDMFMLFSVVKNEGSPAP